MRQRGFEVCSAYMDQEVHLPKRSTTHSAGYDFECIEKIVIAPHQVAQVSTGVKAYMLDDEVLKIFPRSSMSFKKHLVLANSVGIIDKDYYNNPTNEGHIQILLLNTSDKDVCIEKHERIAQGIFEKYLVADVDDSLPIQRLGGFGSTGK